MGIIGIDHVGIAVKDLDATLKLYEERMGLKAAMVSEFKDQLVKSAFIPVGESGVEILESTDPKGPVAKFIEGKGEGLQHVSLRVDDMEKTIEEMKKKGVVFTMDKPVATPEGIKYTFVHPKSFGIIIELIQR
jgi:methylmalonyl-CoA/ethylmalonyl-CoA epimerase